MNDIENFPDVEEIIIETEKEREENWTVDDAGKAEWAITKIKTARTEIQKAKQKRDELIAHAEEIFKQDTAQLDDDIKFFTQKLKPYAENHLIGKSRTIKLPAGKLKFTKQPDKFIFDGGEEASSKSEKLLEWCQKNCPTYIKQKVTYSVDWAALKKNLVAENSEVCTKDGEIIDGLKIYPQTDNFFVVTEGEPENDS